MPKLHLTDQGVRSLKGQSDVVFWDTTLPAFGVRVGKTRKTFVIMVGRDRRRIPLGRYPDLSLSEARAKARRLILNEQDKPTVARTPPFSELLQTFYDTHCATKQKPSSQKEFTRLLNSHFLPTLQNRVLSDIAPQQVQRIIDALLPTPSEALHAFKAIRLFFRWARARHLIQSSPCEGMSAPSKEKSKDRVLNHTELRAVWTAADFYPFGAIVRLLILTGQRRLEVGWMKWEYIDLDKMEITLPSTLTKNSRQHTFPIGPMVTELLETIPKTSPYLFPSRGSTDRPFSGYSPSKTHFDKKTKLAHWTLHDLRRTYATNLAALGTPIHVTEKLLNHVSGTMGGIVSIYQRHGFAPEMRQAIDAWERHLATLLKTA